MSFNVSFGSVVAVSGKHNKINKINNKLYTPSRIGLVMMKDVTNHYKNASSSGILGKSAQNGDKVEIYITGDDINKVKNNHSGWDTLDGILSNLSTYFDADKVSVLEAVNKIMSS